MFEVMVDFCSILSVLLGLCIGLIAGEGFLVYLKKQPEYRGGLVFSNIFTLCVFTFAIYVGCVLL